MGSRHNIAVIDDALEEMIILFDTLVSPSRMSRVLYIEFMGCLIDEIQDRKDEAIAEAKEDGELDEEEG